jgi:hypothetical protein
MSEHMPWYSRDWFYSEEKPAPQDDPPVVQERSQPPPSAPSGLVEEPSEGTQQAN